MIECLPRSLCSWDFTVRGLPGGMALVEYHPFTEQGRIGLPGADFIIRKHGPFSGCWTLEYGEVVMATARKSSAFTRTFQVLCGALPVTLQPVSAFTRVFEILIGGHRQPAGRIVPAHAWTRRSTLENSGNLSAPHLLFLFWLAALTWRRSARQNQS